MKADEFILNNLSDTRTLDSVETAIGKRPSIKVDGEDALIKDSSGRERARTLSDSEQQVELHDHKFIYILYLQKTKSTKNKNF